MDKSIADIPIIKLFTENSKFYVYDTYNNQILNITKEQFEELKKLQYNGISKYRSVESSSIAKKEILLMLDKGYFRAEFIKRIHHPYTDIADVLIRRNVNELILQVTKDCNFKCRYCLFTRDNAVDRCHEKKNMSWDVAKKSIDFLYLNSPDANEINISFYGGEPLLNFNLIKKVVCYSNDLFQSKKIHYSTTINGSLLTEDIMNFFAKNKVSVGISLDGPS